ncbi:MAG: sugar transferase [Fimbriimonadaceae bacterium]|nr:sugar transferase [Fimbriimonadaceae bacterium]
MEEPLLNRNLADHVNDSADQRKRGSFEAGERLPNCIELEPVKLPIGYRIAKRLTDIVLSAIWLLILSPLFLVTMLLVKLYDRGPIFYCSTRVGICGTPIPFWKFRTMVQDADKLLDSLKEHNEKDGPVFKIKCDPRVTPIGRFLRRFSLDELPQLLSVLKGEMSMVGPRPPLPHEVLQYSELDLQRLRVKPGITCFWQVSGRSNLSFQEWMELDRQYVERMNFWLDVQLILRTPLAVISSSGSY